MQNRYKVCSERRASRAEPVGTPDRGRCCDRLEAGYFRFEISNLKMERAAAGRPGLYKNYDNSRNLNLNFSGTNRPMVQLIFREIPNLKFQVDGLSMTRTRTRTSCLRPTSARHGTIVLARSNPVRLRQTLSHQLSDRVAPVAPGQTKSKCRRDAGAPRSGT